jgi:diguanylate cyclase (GGDEF)-like protein
VVAASDPSQLPAEPISDTPWFKAVLKDGKAAVGDGWINAQGQAVVTLAAAITDPSGQTIGLLAGTTGLGAENFLNLLISQKIGNSGGVLLIDPRNNVILASTSARRVLGKAAAPGVNPMHDRARAGYRGSQETVSADGRHVLAAVASVPTADWFIVVQQPLDETLAPEIHARQLIIWSSLGLLGATVLVLAVTLHRLLTPLRKAANQLHAMATGTREIGFLPLHGSNEISDMASGFNFLLSSLQAKEQKLQENEALLAYQAHHDGLTDLPNRALFHERLSQMVLHASRSGSKFALLYLDLDRFKPINDRYGHQAGDAVLQEIAKRLKALLRKDDTVARLGGDEFAILLGNLGDPLSDPQLVANKCEAAVAAPIDYQGQSLTLGLSIGIAIFPEHGQDPAALLAFADAAMYRLKHRSDDRGMTYSI